MSQFHFDPGTYLSMIRSDVARYDELQEETARASEGVRAATILELGTGTGETAKRVLARHGPLRFIGIDKSEAMLSIAREVLPEADLRVRAWSLDLPRPRSPNTPIRQVDGLFSLARQLTVSPVGMWFSQRGVCSHMRAWLHRIWARLTRGTGAQITDEAREARYNASRTSPAGAAAPARARYRRLRQCSGMTPDTVVGGHNQMVNVKASWRGTGAGEYTLGSGSGGDGGGGWPGHGNGGGWRWSRRRWPPLRTPTCASVLTSEPR